MPGRHDHASKRPHSPSASEGYPYYSDGQHNHSNNMVKRPLQLTYSDASPKPSPRTYSEGHFQFEYNDHMLETDDQVTWDSINSYCRLVINSY